MAKTRLPQGLIPESADVLKVIRRDIELVLLPELTSSYARTIAIQIDTALRHLLLREQAFAALLRQLTERYRAVAEQTPIGGAEDGSDSHCKPVDQAWSQACAAAEVLEPDLALRAQADLRSKPQLTPISDPKCLEAIAAEKLFLADALSFENGLVHPTPSPEEAELLLVSPQRLTSYLADRLPGRTNLSVTTVNKVLGGFSKDTFLVDLNSDAGRESVVIRRDNPHGPVNYSVAKEFVLLSALHRKGITVAEPLLLETDKSVFAHPFMVMKKLPGISLAATAGIAVDASHIAAGRALAEVMASFHRAEIREFNLPRTLYDPSLTTADHLHRFLAGCEAGWRKFRLRPSPTLTCAFQWLKRNVPESSVSPRLVHGDAGLHNLLMYEGRPTAMLDWELAHFGDPAEDLTYCRLWIDKVMPWKEFLDHYYLHGGPEYAEEKAVFYANLAKVVHSTFGVKMMRGFMEASYPELSLLFPKLKFTRLFQNQLAASITGQMA